MNLARFSVSRPVAAGIISAALFFLGLFYVGKMPVSLYPEVSLPYISVIVPLPGASPEQIEQKIVKPLEKDLAAIKGAKRVMAYVRPGFARLVVGFKMSVDEREAVNEVRDRTAARRADFPKDTKDPIVSRIDIGATPVLIYGLASDQDAESTKKTLDQGLIRELQRIDGVAEATVIGLGDEQVEVTLLPAKLTALRIAPLDVYQQLAQRVGTIPWGNIRQDGHVFAVSRETLPEDPQFWSDYTLTLADGRTLRLGEIATVQAVRDEDAASIRINGQAGLGLSITKRSDANTLEVVKRVKKQVAAVPASLGIKIFPIVDQSEYIEANTHEVWIALFVGGFFAILVVLLFLTDLKSALISATALPVSVAGTFIFMSWLGFSLNMLSLLALALAIGLLIDDAVVVRESIYAEIEKGKSAREAAVDGTDRVAAAVLATTLAVVAVFLPVSAMSGMVGQFFKEFGLTIVVATLLSLWVAFTLDPMLSARFGGDHRPFRGKLWDSWRANLARLEAAMARLAQTSFKNPLPVVGLALALLAGSAVLVFSRGADFLAFEDRGQLVLSLSAPAGSPKEYTEKLAAQAYELVRESPGLQEVYAVVGKDDETRAELRLVFVGKTERTQGLLSIQREIQRKLTQLPAGTEYLVLEPPPIEGVGGEAPLTISVYGEDLPTLFAEGERIVKDLRQIAGVGGVKMETSRHSPGLAVKLNHQEFVFWNTTPQAVEMTGRLALTGMEAGNVGSDNTPLVVRYGRQERTRSALWDDTFVPTPKGPVLLSALASASDSSSPTRIDREKRSRKVVIAGTLDRSRSYGNVLADVNLVLAKVKAPLHAEISGDKEMFDEMSSNFTIAILGSAFFIFIILAIQFESLLRPFVILLTLPLAAIGAFLGLYLAGEKLALGALIGIVLLIGLAAKNGILLVDAIGVKEKQGGKSLFDAVAESVHERFRPILMTSVAMIFGMLPVALMRGAGSEFRSPMAIAIIGGVVTSTLLSVVMVPAVFGLIARLRRDKSDRQTDSQTDSRSDRRHGRSRSPVSPHHEGSASPRPPEHTPTDGGLGGSIAAQVKPLLLLVGLSAGFLLAASSFDQAQASSAPLAAPSEPRADMKSIKRLLAVAPAATSQEGYIVQAADAAAEGLSSASRLAFLGGLRVEAAHEITRPGITQAVDIPLPPAMGGPIHNEMVLVPKNQDVITVGWTLPLFSMQAIRGLDVAAATREHRDLITRLQREVLAQNKLKLILEYELAQKYRRAQQKRLEVAESRLRTAEARVIAGTSRPIEQDEATATLEAARADWHRAGSELERLRVNFRLQAGAELPAEGFGLTTFPMNPDQAFDPMALRALRSAERIKEGASRVVDAAFYPTLEAKLAHQRKIYDAPDRPEPQNMVAVSLSWTLLDAGTRRRQLADSLSALKQAQSEAAGAHTQLRAAYDTLKTRQDGAHYHRLARQAALRAANQAVAAALAAYQSGAGKMLDVRLADEARFNAELAAFQAELELQALAVESLVLTDRFLAYLDQA